MLCTQINENYGWGGSSTPCTDFELEDRLSLKGILEIFSKKKLYNMEDLCQRDSIYQV